MKIYISGLYNGTNPQPGVGMARSLRQAYPCAKLIGAEYSNRCSGIHWQDFDEVWLQRPWEEINLRLHAAAIGEILDSGAYWISASDLEILWLAREFPEGHKNLLAPPMSALKQTSKPAILAHRTLPFEIPPFVNTKLSDWDLHEFCRKNDWKVWLKGPYYEAVRVRTWAEFENSRRVLTKAWATQKLFLQAHVTGYEESIAFAAYQGELLAAAHMKKRDLTELNKTWSGEVTPVCAEILESLRETVREIKWTGGAELEMVRDADDKLWLLEWNPRFPAWIHGATIAGENIVAALIEGASRISAKPAPKVAREFTRVVLEIPVKSKFPLSPLPEPFGGGIGHSLKHPSGLPQFAKRLHRTNVFAQNDSFETSETAAPRVPNSFYKDFEEIDFYQTETPAFIFLPRTANETFAKTRCLAQNLTDKQIKITNAYSVKTNPDARLIHLALENGFLAEAISPLEICKALEIGFRPSQVILNGPGKWWRREYLPKEALRAVFCDSTKDLQRVNKAFESGDLRAQTIGVRLRAPHLESRFGFPTDSPEVFDELVSAVKTLPAEAAFGIHFHFAASSVGVKSWWHMFQSMLRFASLVERFAGRRVETLDVGGGWFPDDAQNGFRTDFARAVRTAREILPFVSEIVCEPGKALAQPSMALAMRILEILNDEEVVVDGSISELPMYFFHPHRILYRRRNGHLQTLRHGKTKLFGRLCMEHDVVAQNVELPDEAQAGDILLFCDAGAYDQSMSYEFGRG
jgi:diaminopimelate decarboxylase